MDSKAGPSNENSAPQSTDEDKHNIEYKEAQSSSGLPIIGALTTAIKNKRLNKRSNSIQSSVSTKSKYMSRKTLKRLVSV